MTWTEPFTDFIDAHPVIVITIGIILWIPLIYYGVRLFLRCCYSVQVEEGECCVMERWGGYHSTLTKGSHIRLPLVDTLRKIQWGRYDEYGQQCQVDTIYIPTCNNTILLREIPMKTKDLHFAHLEVSVSFRIDNVRHVVYKDPGIYWKIQEQLLDRLKRIVRETRIPDLTVDNINKLYRESANTIQFEKRGITAVTVEVEHIELPPEIVLEKKKEIMEIKRGEEEKRSLFHQTEFQKIELQGSLEFLKSHLVIVKESVKEDAAIATIIAAVMMKRSGTCVEQND